VVAVFVVGPVPELSLGIAAEAQTGDNPAAEPAQRGRQPQVVAEDRTSGWPLSFTRWPHVSIPLGDIHITLWKAGHYRDGMEQEDAETTEDRPKLAVPKLPMNNLG
jgi:hypothetical protein